MDQVIDAINHILWGYILIYGLLTVGIFYSFKLGFPQIVHFPEMLRALSSKGSEDSTGISPRQALSVSLASRVGTGNIAGVAVALYLGGPGAIFWMWMVALVGMSSAYAESTLAQLYKSKGPMGNFRGGPAYYIERGLGKRWLGIIFSLCLILSFGLVFNAVQSNAIAGAMDQAFGVPKLTTGVVIGVLTAIVIFGGIKKIAKVAEIIVPFMAATYLLLTVVIMIINYATVPDVILSIVKNAFGIQEAVGGVTGGVMVALLNGIKRGLFSNEAGMGSAPNIAASATPVPHHPSSQGFVQAFGVFIDTICVCTATAVVILLSGIYQPGVGPSGVELTQLALAQHIGETGFIFIAVAIFFFAFTSIIGNYSYAENAMIFLGVQSTKGLVGIRIGLIAMVIWGSIQSVETVFNTADASMGLMAIINLVSISLLSGIVFKLTKDYIKQRKAGLDPTFHAPDHPELCQNVDQEIWTDPKRVSVKPN
ncbi:sodium:alanine symporter [Oleiphilus sp. HI0125]|uniref:alanine/glycine:cation symporter family protein n=2 Tax=Oleiphilus sp. HI0125 TaxID=1822266 RepID=UPI0007C343F5|nr:alanine/glycine:cation symporter family protein [Oleiphilus sp. HI0125]KZZ57179.1 sodium:alanine symporter [Oleiphilus sp. HI0125]